MTLLDRCSDPARDRGQNLIATVGSFTAVLCVEWPAPWPRDATEVPELARIVEALRGRRIRLQLVRSLSPNAGEVHRILFYRSVGDGCYAGLRGSEATVTRSAVVETALRLLDEPDAGNPPRCRNLLLCTHGTRDRCCGSLGTKLATALDRSPTRLPSDVRVWRTTHLGGHRFAPTALELPAGAMWGNLDADALRRIATRSDEPRTDIHLLRGFMTPWSPMVQPLERAAFDAAGWDWVTASRHGHADSDGRVRIDAVLPGGRQVRWSGFVSVRTDTVPLCHAVGSTSETRYSLEAFRTTHDEG